MFFRMNVKLNESFFFQRNFFHSVRSIFNIEGQAIKESEEKSSNKKFERKSSIEKFVTTALKVVEGPDSLLQVYGHRENTF